MRAAAVVLALLLAGCPKQGGSSPEGGSAATSTDTKGGGEGNCTAKALRLGDAKLAKTWTVPTGCSFASSGGGGIPRVITTDAELRALLTCTGQPALNVAFDKESLVVASKPLPPAGVGTDIYDDGKTITFVSKQRSPCPKDPLPMPLMMNYVVSVPKGTADRAYADVACTVETHCP